MASLITVRISKGDSPNLGFRLQGGKDFATPLVIQKVNVGSPAERAGLVAGDSVIKINDTDVFNLRHKDAQDVVVRAGPAFEITLQRGGSTWKPSVIPTGSFPTPSPVINNVSPVTRTSLTAPKGENIGAIGTGHNLSAKPFSPQVNGTVNGGPKVVNKQYNSPLKLYSEESIAETLSAQTEVLSTGALGVNFKKNEKNYDASNSAVLRMLQESENEPRTADEEPESGVVTAPNSGIAGLRHVKAPESRPAPSTPQLPPGQNICADCERLIVGVFVRIKDKNLHVECFKCATCGTSLKNVGYYNINNKLYCDIHAKSAAIRINANPNLVPVTVPPGGKPPVQAISSALASHSLPTSSPLSPKINNSFSSPYQPQETNENADVSPPLPNLSTNVTSEANNNNNSLYNNSAPLSFSKYLNKSSTSFSGPKPFSSVSAPLSPPSTLPRAAPLSPITPTAAPSYNAPSYNAPSYSAPSYKAPSYSPASSAEHASEVCHANEIESFLELDEVGLQIPDHPPPPPPVPISQINITIPYQCTSPQLDSIGSSPRSDYSSYSSSSSKNPQNANTEIAREKILSEIRNLTPKLKKVNISGTQSPRMNYIVNNVETTVTNNTKNVKSELLIPVNDYTSLNQDNFPLPDNLTFANQSNNDKAPNETSKAYFSSVTKDSKDYKNKDHLPEAPICWKCNTEIARGPFITALGKIWCPNHFICTTPSCRRPLQDLGFVEERGQLYCEFCFEQYLAPPCAKCSGKIKGDCLKAIGKNFHPECFNCVYCGKLFGNSPFFLEDGSPYCEADWNELFTTKCFACGFPVEAGDRWVEALNNNYHSQCFNCTMCKKNLEGQSFFAKGGRPFCKNHAR
ncbi:PDZ and LIM domain protein Zasp isoform X2 [Anoplophora glabripennis]|uniref:PDZ and LIM domain protein Zasp isoform X2 n=1 Tax=Anoplophora glabripennis TaxID=217634 RepID=UPI000873A399|nr:PDZ and LIM domain protein Zasp isoform X2 [Anoplophora glabripennis]